LEKVFKVGIAWRGNTGQYNDGIRSTALADWAPVFAAVKTFNAQHSTLNIQLESLQVDGAEEALLYPQLVVSDPPRDWSETAARLAELDLLISVDTGIVHLAGAMGLPVWCALHCRPYFVFPIASAGTPWYPTVKLFKQKTAYEWETVFGELARELSAFAALHGVAAVPVGLVRGAESGPVSDGERGHAGRVGAE
jgi:hypothetical protein